MCKLGEIGFHASDSDTMPVEIKRKDVVVVKKAKLNWTKLHAESADLVWKKITYNIQCISKLKELLNFTGRQVSQMNKKVIN